MSQMGKSSKELSKIAMAAMGEFDPKDEKRILLRFNAAIVYLNKKFPAYGYFLSTLKPEIDYTIEGICDSDGYTIYLNPKMAYVVECMSGTKFDGYSFGTIIINTILKLLHEHFERRGDREVEKFDGACEFEVNDFIKEHMIANGSKLKWHDMLMYDDKYRDKTAEYIYEHMDDTEQPQPQNGQGSSGSGGGQGSQGQADSSDPSSCPDPKLNENGQMKMGGSSKMHQKRDEQTRAKLKQDLLNKMLTAQRIGREMSGNKGDGIGSFPAYMLEKLNALKEPELSLEDVIKAVTTSLVAKTQSWQTLDRRMVSRGYRLPGEQTEQVPHLCVFYDTSGSVSREELTRYHSEIVAAISNYDEFKLSIGCFDTEIHNFVEFDENDDIGDIEDYDMVGRGGTDVSVCHHFLLAKHEQEDFELPQQVIICSDSGTLEWGIPDFIDTLFVLVDGDNKPPFGDYVFYNTRTKQARWGTANK